MLFKLLVLFSFLTMLLLLRNLVNIMPSLLACLIRGKESLNLEVSVKLRRDRNIIALAMIVPFCLTAYRYRLYFPGFLDGFSQNAYLGMCFVVFLAYVCLRVVTTWLFRPKRMPDKTYVAADKVSYSFFIIYASVLLAMGAALGLMDMPDEGVRRAMLWVSAAIYALFLIRKMQIFAISCSIFAAFLYLCALEMIPTGILVVSAIIF